MGLLAALRERFHDEDVSLDLDDIQALILRNRPEPYFGLHAMLHVDDPAGGRDLMARLAPHIPSAAGFTEDLESWTGVAVSFAGLQALGLPEESLASFRWRSSRAWPRGPTSCGMSVRTPRSTGTKGSGIAAATSRSPSTRPTKAPWPARWAPRWTSSTRPAG